VFGVEETRIMPVTPSSSSCPRSRGTHLTNEVLHPPVAERERDAEREGQRERGIERERARAVKQRAMLGEGGEMLPPLPPFFPPPALSLFSLFSLPLSLGVGVRVALTCGGS